MSRARLAISERASRLDTGGRADEPELARALHKEIKEITKQPVKLVINENGQGHAMLGNGYWVDQGVPVLAHKDAAHEFEERGADILDRMKQLQSGQSRRQPCAVAD